MNLIPRTSTVLAFCAAVLLATIWGAVVQTQYNLSALARIGADVDGGLRTRTALADVFSGFTPTYGGYIVLPALLVAFVVAHGLAQRLGRLRLGLFALAGALAIALGIPVVNALSPVALLVGASRELSCIAWMALGGAVAGLLFARLSLPDRQATSPSDRGTEQTVSA
jgi:hypothetical protein